MICNKTIHFMKMRQGPIPAANRCIILPIRIRIAKLEEDILDLKKRMNKLALPSFSSREGKLKELDSQRHRINVEIKEAEKEIRGIRYPEDKITKSMQSYFIRMLKRVVLDYRKSQQESLREISTNGIAGAGFAASESERLLEETVQRTTNIRKNILQLTGTIAELKTALTAQNAMLDRIDYFLENSNFYLGETVKEIEKIPGGILRIKDFIIYVLIYIICVLLVLTAIKIHREHRI